MKYMDKSKNSTSIEDNLAGDLLTIIEDCRLLGSEIKVVDEGVLVSSLIDEKALMMKLTSYVVRRDHKVFDHAFKLGKNGTKS